MLIREEYTIFVRSVEIQVQGVFSLAWCKHLNGARSLETEYLNRKLQMRGTACWRKSGYNHFPWNEDDYNKRRAGGSAKELWIQCSLLLNLSDRLMDGLRHVVDVLGGQTTHVDTSAGH